MICAPMTHLVFDTNILIDYLGGNLDALAVIDGCDHPVISKIVYMEVMVGCRHSALVRNALPVRKQTHRKLPDTVIHATAILNGWDIVTRNPDDFPQLTQISGGYQNVKVIVPYALEP
jgi:predicted nucleic acid-binding protein